MKILNFCFLSTLLVTGVFSFTSLAFAGVYNATTPPIISPEQMSVIGISM